MDHAAHTESTDSMLQALDSATVKTWFDLGLLLDTLRDNRPQGAAFDGTPTEYLALCQQRVGVLGGPSALAPAGIGLDDALEPWAERAMFCGQRLERGSADYNALIATVWAQSRALAETLARRIAAEHIECLVVRGLWSRPEHLPAALAVVLLCEHLRLPVVAEHEQPWWRSPDAVSANAHLGEVFSVVETCFPWDAPLAAHVAADVDDAAHLTAALGVSPAHVVSGHLDTALRAVAEVACGQAYGETTHDLVVEALTRHREMTVDDPDFHAVAAADNRQYLPGLSPLEYIIKLNSLIDPSAFRIEEKELRGRVFDFARARAGEAGLDAPTTRQLLHAVAFIFDYHVGEDELVVDHSMSYRHRHRRHYPYRKLTENEVCGWVGLVAEALAEQAQPGLTLPAEMPRFSLAESVAWALGVDGGLAIDNSQRLHQAISHPAGFAWLPNAEDRMAFAREAALLAEFAQGDGPVTLLLKPGWGSGSITRSAAEDVLARHPELKARTHIVETHGVSRGTHLQQLGARAAAALVALREAGGSVVAFGHANTLSLDLLRLHSLRIGVCARPLEAAYMGLDAGDAYCLWVPAELRPSLAYPTPIQTPRDFAAALSSDAFQAAVLQDGEPAVLARLAEDANRYGTPVARLLAADGAGADSAVDANLLTGVHDNGAPWSGAHARISAADGWRFSTVFAQSKSDTVLDLITQFRNAGRGDPALAWNGGYILNAELVGKLGLPEDYIGSPLGLLIDQGRVRSLPLFNKPALGFAADGGIVLKEANLEAGLTVGVGGGDTLEFGEGDRNVLHADAPSFFDLLADVDAIDLRGRTAYRFAADRIISVHAAEDSLPMLPVGLTVVVPGDAQPAGWAAGASVDYTLPAWDGVVDAIEAGPMLVRDGLESIEMDAGGWTRQASIRTQAARLDYTHMRGPKIGVGLTADEDLIVVAINGRIRESVGATHGELARILLDMGAERGMGFDPGGSVTLVVGDRQLNISPYNRGYIDSPLTAPPQPRFVGNAILAVPSRASASRSAVGSVSRKGAKDAKVQ